MKSQTIVTIIVVLIVIAVAWYFLMMPATATAPTPAMQSGTPAVSGAAGINGSVNQGNLGQPATGQVQQPGGSAAEDQGVGDASAPAR